MAFYCIWGLQFVEIYEWDCNCGCHIDDHQGLTDIPQYVYQQ